MTPSWAFPEHVKPRHSNPQSENGEAWWEILASPPGAGSISRALADHPARSKNRRPQRWAVCATLAWGQKATPKNRLTPVFLQGYIPQVEWEVEFTDEFEEWWESLTEDEQIDVDAKVRLLERAGPALRRPHSGPISASRHPNMKELIIQHAGRPYRVLYAFDPRRCAILLIGGDKTGDDRWYESFVPIADRLYDEHLAGLREEGLTNG